MQSINEERKTMATKTAVKNGFKAANNSGAAVSAAVEHLASLSQTALLGEADLIEMVETWLQGKLEQKMNTPKAEFAEPQPWWDIYAFGPFQGFAPFPGPLAPNSVIKLGQSASVITVVYLNPFDNVIAAPPTTARDFLTSFGSIPYHVTVNTGNKSSWTLAAGAGLNTTQSGVLAPFGTTFFLNAFTFTPSTVGLHEMNITARIGNVGSAAPFGGYASWIWDTDTDIFGQAPGWNVNIPVLFEVYD
jgi:hypothetical protein